MDLRSGTVTLLGIALWCATPRLCVGQGTAAPATTEDALRAMADAAGVIFTGTVTAVRRPATAGVIEIDFAVADAVRGVSGATYTLREWSGLWPANDEPFLPGQRYLMLLHAPNAAGLSSPVGGPDGAIPIHGSGASPAGAASPASSPRAALVHGTAIPEAQTAGEDVVDLGWVATRVLVPLAYAGPAPRPILTPGVHAAVVQPLPATTENPAPSAGVPAALPGEVRASSYSAVLNTLRAWERNRNAAR